MSDKPTARKKRTTRRWSEDEAVAAGERLGQGEQVRQALASPTLADSLRRLGLPVAEAPAGPKEEKAAPRGRGKAKPATPDAETIKPTKPKKRRGVETKPIFDSLANTPARCRWGEDWIALDFPGGRALSYNELYSILQFRKYEAFRFKKICRQAVQRALDNPDQVAGCKRPFFDAPTRLTLLRVGAKGMDREALTVIFKYFTDTLKREGVIEDDNPEIIVDVQTIQGQGEPRLAMKLERVYNWTPPPVPRWSDWK